MLSRTPTNRRCPWSPLRLSSAGLRSSSTFQTTVIEAKRLAEEVAAFSALPHTDEEWDGFRKAWQTKAEKFAERIAEGDRLAVEVILKAIEKESERGGAQ
jgi:hypothetical protein